ncbi:MAG: hypothetical protein ACFFAY_13705 [Promethearchaeota archaeon]
MTTTLKKFDDAYATMTVAAYEPLVLKWISGYFLCNVASVMAWRANKSQYIDLDKAFTTARALMVKTPRPQYPETLKDTELAERKEKSPVVNTIGQPLAAAEVKEAKIAGFPNAVAVGERIHPRGVLKVHLDSDRDISVSGSPELEVKTLPTFISGTVGSVAKDFDFNKAESQIFNAMVEAAKTAIISQESISKSISSSLRAIGIYQYLPLLKIEEALSPIGVAHFYKQYYFNSEEGFGPIEEAFTIAPKETLEVVYEKTRKQTHEEIVEIGSEVINEEAEEVKNLDEVSDKVSNMIQRDTSASMSADVSGGIGVWSFGASAGASIAASSQRSTESISRRLKEVTKRASERITKTYSIKTRDIEEITEVNLTRRVISNDGAEPISYGLRRILRRVQVKIQDLGPRLVWQLYVQAPGSGLARSRFVHFREAEPISVPEIPPGVPPRPKGGTDTGSTSSEVAWSSSKETYYVTVVIQTGADRIVTGVSIDSITDLEGGGKGDTAPSPRNDVQWNPEWDESTRTYSVNIGILPGDAFSVSIDYTYSWDPSQAVLDEWENQRQQAVAAITQELMEEQFEREKTLITERSKIRKRPANELRQEERYEVINRMVSEIFGRGDDPSEPAPLEIEYFHRYFDIGGMFIYTHPSWWKPRYSSVSTNFQRPAYEITAESETAPLGSSLGWLIQLDGDNRRNEFLNSPWLRICLPMRPGRERETIQWLAKHVEGEVGYDINASPLRDMLIEIETRRNLENSLGRNGPEYVTVDSTVGAPEDPLKPECVFPIVDEFYVTVPTDGFVFDELKLE